MRIYGKVFGGILGWLILRHPIGLVIGIALGHVLDAGWLNREVKDGGDLEQAYRTLGVSSDANVEDIDLAYRRLMAQYHPDKVAGAAEEIRDLAEQRARDINGAYDAVMAARRGSAT